MNKAKRIGKRIAVIMVFGIVFFILGLAVYFMIKPDPTCSDGIQNQREKGIDCGGPCSPCIEPTVPSALEVVNVEFVHFVGNKYDAVVKIKNPNQLLGAERAKIVVRLLSEDGRVLDEKEVDNVFALPKEEKPALVYGLESQETPYRAEAEFDAEVDWKKFSQYEEPRLLIINKTYQEATGGVAWFSQARGMLINKSGIDYETINAIVILRDVSGRVLAINSQVMNTVRSNEQRDFVVFFSNNFPGDVAEVEVWVETNIFDNENYIKVHGSVEGVN